MIVARTRAATTQSAPIAPPTIAPIGAPCDVSSELSTKTMSVSLESRRASPAFGFELVDVVVAAVATAAVVVGVIGGCCGVVVVVALGLSPSPLVVGELDAGGKTSVASLLDGTLLGRVVSVGVPLLSVVVMADVVVEGAAGVNAFRRRSTTPASVVNSHAASGYTMSSIEPVKKKQLTRTPCVTPLK